MTKNYEDLLAQSGVGKDALRAAASGAGLASMPDVSLAAQEVAQRRPSVSVAAERASAALKENALDQVNTQLSILVEQTNKALEHGGEKGKTVILKDGGHAFVVDTRAMTAVVFEAEPTSFSAQINIKQKPLAVYAGEKASVNLEHAKVAVAHYNEIVGGGGNALAPRR